MMKHLRKFISLALIFALMLNTLSIGYAQAVGRYDYFNGNNDNLNIRELEMEALSSSIKQFVDEKNAREVYKENFIKQTEKEDKETFYTRKQLKEYFKTDYEFGRIMKSFDKQLYDKAIERWKKAEYKEDAFILDPQDKICYGEYCYSYKIFMKALISAWLEYHVQGDAILATHNIKYLQEAVFLGAISLEDRKQLFNLLKEGVKKEIKVCGGRKGDAKEEDRCEELLAGVTILADIWETEQESRETADLIYDILEGYYGGRYDIMVLIQTISALSFIDTDYSFELIEKFFTKSMAPSKIGNKTRDFFSLFSATGEYEIWSEFFGNIVREGAHYYNRHNVTWQYIKEEETKKENIDPAFLLKPGTIAYELEKDDLTTSYRVVYGNILTDIGEFLTKQSWRGEKFGDKIVQQYLNADSEELKNIHIPLVLGVIQNLNTKDAARAAERLQRTYYYDLNGGTGKWVQEKATAGGKYNYNYSPIYPSERAYRDVAADKKAAACLDIVIFFVSFISIMKKIPNMLFKLKNLGNIIRFRRMASFGSAVVINDAAGVANAAKVTGAVATQPATVAAVASNTTNVLSKIRNVAKSTNFLKQSMPGQLSLSFSYSPAFSVPHTISLSKGLAVANGVLQASGFGGNFGFPTQVQMFGENFAKPAQTIDEVERAAFKLKNKSSTSVFKPLAKHNRPFEELQNSVLKLEMSGYSATGYVTEIPVYGINKQVIISAGHFSSVKPDSPVNLYDRKGNFLGQAHTMFFNDARNIDLSIQEDYALLLPDKELPLKPLNLDFDKSIYSYPKIRQIGYPKGKYKVSYGHPDSNAISVIPYQGIAYLRGGSIGGFSGSPIIAKTARGKYSVLGTLLATTILDSGEKYTLIKNFDWLKHFIKGEPISANFRFPTFPPISFIRSNPKVGNINPEVIDISSALSQEDLLKFSSDKIPSSLSQSVFKLRNEIGGFSGYLTEVPIYGVNRQAIITVGYPFVRAPSSKVEVFDNLGKHLTNAQPLFFNFSSDKGYTYLHNYALLIPEDRLSLPSIKLTFNKSLYDNNSVTTVGFFNKNLSVKTTNPLPKISGLLKAKEVEYIRGISSPGEYGGPVLVENAPKEYSSYGTIIGYGTGDNGDISLVQNLNWLDKFIRGQLNIPQLAKLKFDSFMRPLFKNLPKVTSNVLQKGSSNTLPVPTASTPASKNFSVTESVFNLMDPEGQFTGFLAEVPIFGIKRQVIVSVGHAIGVMPEAPVIISDKNQNILTTGHLVFSNFVEDSKTGEITRDFSLLLPWRRLTQTPLQLDFNPKLENYNSIWYVGYPNGKFLTKKLTPVLVSNSFNKNLLSFDGKIDYGGSSGVILGEKQGNFFALGTSVAKARKEGGGWITKGYKFNWLDKFIKGKLDISKLWAPNFRESFIKPNKLGNLPDIPYNSDITIKLTSSHNSVALLKQSVFQLKHFFKQFTGYLVELPIGGVIRQAIITVGHGVKPFPKLPVRIYDNFDEPVTKADVLFHHFNISKDFNNIEDFAILLPRQKINKPSLKISFDTDINKYDKVLSLSFPEGRFFSEIYKTASSISKDANISNVRFLEGEGGEGSSGGAVLVETEPGRFSVVGTIFANHEVDEKKFVAVHNLNWLDKFIKGKLDISKLWAPNFRESFIKPNKFGNLPDVTYNEGITEPFAGKGVTISMKNASRRGNVQNAEKAIFKLENVVGQFTGYLAEVPIYGVNKQVIITAGHGVAEAPGAVINVFDNQHNFITKARTMLFNFNYDKGMRYWTDYALLLPEEHISVPSLSLTFNKSLYGNRGIKTIDFSDGELRLINQIPDAYASSLRPLKDIEYLRGMPTEGASGSPILAEDSNHNFSSYGTLVGFWKNKVDGEYSVVQNLNWLYNFTHGIPLRANFLFPFYPPSKFAISNPRIIKNYSHPFEFKRGILKSGQKNVSEIVSGTMIFRFDRPYFPLESFNTYEKATLFPMGNINTRTSPFWLVSDVFGNINKFLYYGTEADIRRMYFFGRLIEEHGLKGKYELIDIDYPQFITEIDEDLPLNVSEEFAEIKGNINYPSNAIFVPYTTTPIRLSGAVWVDKDPFVNNKFIENSSFANRPITEAEWDEVIALFQDINNNGFVFDDLEKSIILKRDESNKLIVGIKQIKESVLLSDNYADIKEIGKHFERVGLKEPNPYTDNF